MQLNTYASLAATKPEVSVSEFRCCRSAGVNNTLTTPKKNLTRKFINSSLRVTKLFLFPHICCQKWLITTPSITHIELKRKIHTQHVAWGKKWFLKTEIVRQLLLKALLTTRSSQKYICSKTNASQQKPRICHIRS